MIVLRIIGCILLLMVIFVLLGKLLCGKTHNPVLEWVVGFFAVLALFEVISLPCIFLRRSLKELSLVMFAVIGGLCLISFVLHGKELIEAVKEFRWKKPEMLVVVVLLLVLLQTFVLGFGNHIDDLPLDKEGRTCAMDLLIEFGENITKRMKISPDEKDFSEEVEKYAKGMRATSDYSSRVYRNEALEEVLQSVFV